MSLLNKNIETIQAGSGYRFSSQAATKFTASEYTLVSVACDKSGSVQLFAQQLAQAIKLSLGACKKSPRVENLMARATTFNSKLEEFHGFEFLKGLDLDKYDDLVAHPYGATLLRDAIYESVEVLEAEGERLNKLDIMTNAILFIITDGDDNGSNHEAAAVKARIAQARANENSLESLNIVLIGITGSSSGLTAYLRDLKSEVGIDQYVDIGSATEGSLAKLADFVSRSISSTSQALGSGGASKALTF